MRFWVVLLGVLTHGLVWGHEFTPTYPELETSYMPGVLKAEMHLFNSRKDINYYQVSVYDENWNPVKFATESKIIQMDYLCLLYTSPSPRDGLLSRMPSSA